jgi:hypothetical protein
METDVSTWSVLRCYKQGAKSVEREFYMGAVKRGNERVKMNHLHC